MLAVFVLCLALEVAAQARPVRVRGGARIAAQARFVEGDVLELSGRLTDEGLAPLEDAFVAVTTRSGLLLDDAGGCPDLPIKVARGRLRMVTDAGGEFCLRWTEAPERGRIKLRFAGDRYHGAAELSVTFDRAASQKLSTNLQFDPRPVSVDLDQARMTFAGSLQLGRTTAHADRGGLEVLMLNEDGEKLASGKTSGDGRLRLQLSSDQLGDPGQGKLELRFLGNDDLLPSSDVQPIVRRATVSLALEDAVSPVSRGDTAVIDVRVFAARGQVTSGVIEAMRGGASVASAPVEGGRSELTMRFDDDKAQQVELRLRYLAASPWWRAGQPLDVTVPIAPPSQVWRALLALLVLVAGAWVAASWRRSDKPAPASEEPPPIPPGVHVVASKRRERGFRGVVRDAHEREPLAGVEITVQAPTLEDDGVVLRTETDDEGRFEFELEPLPDGAEIVAECDSHSAERKRLPPAGRFEIALVTRRRAVLRRLVRWAKARGAPYDTKPEPTPAQVRRAGREREEVRDWAAAVERVAFGPEPVHREHEHALRDDEPGAGAG
jgi:hypothetical protein